MSSARRQPLTKAAFVAMAQRAGRERLLDATQGCGGAFGRASAEAMSTEKLIEVCWALYQIADEDRRVAEPLSDAQSRLLALACQPNGTRTPFLGNREAGRAAAAWYRTADSLAGRGLVKLYRDGDALRAIATELGENANIADGKRKRRKILDTVQGWR